ncbi:MAG: DUF2269 domain-containing protein [Actinomycetota bacterium]|nr:DUF2269 domain-containing protein [Actinomycetota bacterium]
MRHDRRIFASIASQHTATRHTIYVLLVVVHIITAVVGFGAVAVSGVYGGLARRASPGGVSQSEEVRRYFGRPVRAELLLLAVPFVGLGAVAADRQRLAQVWIVGALIIWWAAAGLYVGVVRPAEAALCRLALDKDGDPTPSMEAEQAGTRLVWAAGICNLAFFVALVLMVIRPT